MATSHLYALNTIFATDSWSAAGVKCRNLWVWDGSVWRLAKNQWIWDGSQWRLGFTTNPGPLDHVVVVPSSASVAQGNSFLFQVQGRDADGLFVDVSTGHTISWSVDTIGDTIDSDGTFHAGTFTTPPYNVTVTVAVDGTYSATANVTVT